MNTRKIFKESLKGVDRKEAARVLGMSAGCLNNQIAGEMPYTPKGDTPNFVDRVVALIDICQEQNGKHLLLESLAEEFGFILIHNPAVTVNESPAIGQISKILKEFSFVVDEISVANSDGVITKHEAIAIREKWEILKRQLEEFTLACETGKYEVKNEY